jgi:hypothetical protein
MTRDQQDDRQGDHVLTVELAVAQLLVDEFVEHTVAGLALLLFAVDQLADVQLELVAGVEGVGGRRAAQQAPGPAFEEVVVGVRDAEQRADHRGRHGQREGAHQLGGRPLGHHRVDPFVHDLLDARAQRGGAFEGEARDHHPPLGAVFGVVDAQQCGLPVPYGREARRRGGEVGPGPVGGQARVGQQGAGGGMSADQPRRAAVEEGDPGQRPGGAQGVVGGRRVVGTGSALGEGDRFRFGHGRPRRRRVRRADPHEMPRASMGRREVRPDR